MPTAATYCADWLQDNGIKPTANRMLVVRTLAEAARPLSMSEIEDELLTVDKSVISRTLGLLRERHLVHLIDGAEEGVRYELCHSHSHTSDEDQHLHFYCEQCHKTLCLEEIEMPSVNLPDGFLSHSSSFVIKGLCPTCSQRTRM